MSAATNTSPVRQWTTWAPVLAVIVLALGWGRELPGVAVAAIGVCLIAAVLAAVHHAEVIAHRVGEPLGSLVLAVAVTVIEVGLIVMLMSGGGDKVSTYARDTVFAAVMITCNGIVGLCLLAGAFKNRIVVFNAEGSGGALATVITLASMTLVLPSFTIGARGQEFTGGQLAFAAVASLCLYGLFVAVQTVRHRDYFLPVQIARPRDHDLPLTPGDEPRDPEDPEDLKNLKDFENPEEHAQPPSARETVFSVVLLLVALVAVVGNAKLVSPAIENGVESAGLPYAVVGVVIALMVLLPETLAAVRAARRDRMQTSLNLAYGSAIASIGLTVPAIALASVWLPGDLILGLDPVHLVLLALTAVVSGLTVVPGRATLLQGGVHMSLFAAFVFLSLSP